MKLRAIGQIWWVVSSLVGCLVGCVFDNPPDYLAEAHRVTRFWWVWWVVFQVPRAENDNFLLALRKNNPPNPPNPPRKFSGPPARLSFCRVTKRDLARQLTRVGGKDGGDIRSFNTSKGRE